MTEKLTTCTVVGRCMVGGVLPGGTIDLSDKDIKRLGPKGKNLVKVGGKKPAPTSDDSGGDSETKPQSADELIEQLKTANAEEVLAIKSEEENGKKRKTVLAACEARAEELDAPE